LLFNPFTLEQILSGMKTVYQPACMVNKVILRLTIIVLVLFCFPVINAQFYNGLQMNFGKNRVQYYDYYWSFYRFDNIDCYFNENGSDLAKFTADYAIKKLSEIEDYFDYNLEKRLIFIIYNKQAEYKQSNIGLVTFSDDDYNLGGYSRLIKNKVMLYYEGDHVAFEKQISASITEAIINEMISGADLKDRVSSSSQISMPDWYLKGLINYVAFGWDYNAENIVKDGFKTGKFKKISHLEYDDAIYAGQSFWRFIGNQYGDALIPNIIYLTKIYKNIDDGFLYVLGTDLKYLFIEWQNFYKQQFADDKDNPSNDGNILKKGKKDQVLQELKISPDKKYLAYVTNDWGRKRIWLYDRETGKTRIVFRAEPKYEQKTDKTYPVIAWHPNSRILTFINEEKANLQLYFYRVNEKTYEKRLLLYFDKVLDFSYSPEGTRLVFSAVKDGITDIYIHTIASGTNDQITRDLADDLNPSFMKNSSDEIIFTSNRLTDTLSNTGNPFERLSPTFDLFTYNILKRPDLVTRLTEGQYNDRFQPVSTGKTTLSFLSNNNGVFNRYESKFDSSISYIDTITHYRYYIKSVPVTNYDRNIIDHDVVNSSDSYGEVIYDKGRYLVRKGDKAPSPEVKEKDLIISPFRKEQTRLLHKADSIEQLRQWLLEEDRKRRDTLTKPLYEYYVKNEPIDINHYIFEKEKQNYYEQLWRKKYMDVDLDTGILRMPLIRIYQPSFYNNYIANQIDFSFLSNSYQAYNGGAPYFNPGVNLFTRIGTLDLFENYKVTGGFRFSGNFDSNEYLLSVENLMGKFDKQLIYHRQTFNSQSGDTLYKIHSDNLYLSFARPLSPVLALKGTVSYRFDKYVTLSTDVVTLGKKDVDRHWASLKGEVIYDNTRKRSINIYYGTRFKVFGEYYKEISARKSDMIVLGIDFRHYIKIHRELIWANRFAASTSYGPTKLIYYLGGVDNWMGYFFSKIPMFDNTIPVNQKQYYGFQALATNMRGFSQNVRNGNNFALINSEIRWPVIRYFAGHPLRSNFLNSLQVVGFGDIGTAWSGKSPWSGENAYDNQEIVNGPITVTLDTNRQPIVGGFGAGLRAQLLGYFVRADWAWGVEDHYILPRVFYLSFSLDF
jgi:Tol biopolymer transport system component